MASLRSHRVPSMLVLGNTKCLGEDCSETWGADQPRQSDCAIKTSLFMGTRGPIKGIRHFNALFLGGRHASARDLGV